MSMRMNPGTPRLFGQVIEGCRTQNSKKIAGALHTLIGSGRFPADAARLCRLCLWYLYRNRLADIRRTFERLSAGWMAHVETAAVQHELKQALDVEVYEISDETCGLATGDPVVAGRIGALRGTALDTIERTADGEVFWRFTVHSRWLKRALTRLRRPHYWEFLEKNKSRQLKLEF